MTGLAEGVTVDGYVLLSRRPDTGPGEAWNARDPLRPDAPVVVHVTPLGAGVDVVNSIRAEGHARALAARDVRLFEDLQRGLVGFAETLPHARRRTQVDGASVGQPRTVTLTEPVSRPSYWGLVALGALSLAGVAAIVAFLVGRTTARFESDDPSDDGVMSSHVFAPTAFAPDAGSPTASPSGTKTADEVTPLRRACSSEEVDVSTDRHSATCVDLHTVTMRAALQDCGIDASTTNGETLARDCAGAGVPKLGATVNCVDLATASRCCKKRGGSLPSVSAWRAASAQSGFEASQVFEWTADAAGISGWHRTVGASGAAQAPDTRTESNLGFRCAREVSR